MSIRNGYIYLLSEYIWKEDIIKIGMSKELSLNRIKSYNKCNIYIIGITNNYLNIEKEIINELKKKYELVKGNEYFKGNKNEIILEVKEILYKHNCKVIENDCLNNFQKVCESYSTEQELTKLKKELNELYDFMDIHCGRRVLYFAKPGVCRAITSHQAQIKHIESDLKCYGYLVQYHKNLLRDIYKFIDETEKYYHLNFKNRDNFEKLYKKENEVLISYLEKNFDISNGIRTQNDTHNRNISKYIIELSKYPDILNIWD